MDDRSVVARRDLNRDFHVNRHSLGAIANAFQLLSSQHRLNQADDSTVQTDRETLQKQQLQEA